eukprot:364867-Chlamydomonas_euryale.AAC.6
MHLTTSSLCTLRASNAHMHPPSQLAKDESIRSAELHERLSLKVQSRTKEALLAYAAAVP